MTDKKIDPLNLFSFTRSKLDSFYLEDGLTFGYMYDTAINTLTYGSTQSVKVQASRDTSSTVKIE